MYVYKVFILVFQDNIIHLVKNKSMAYLLFLLALITCFLSDSESMSKNVYNVVVLGNTGVGKSSLLNMLAGMDAFKVGDGAMSETSLTTAQLHKLMGKPDGIQLRLIDTQGLSDSGGNAKDMEHIKNMVNYIRQEQSVDMFIIFFDGQSPRFAGYTQSTVNLFQQIFPDFMQHAVLVFNKWTSPDVNRMNNQRAEYQQLFQREYGIANIPCFFIDSFFNRAMLRDNEDGSQTVRHLHPNIQERTQKQIDGLMHFLLTKPSYCDVRTIEAKNTEIEELRRAREAVELRRRQEEEDNRRRLEQQRLENERILEEKRFRGLTFIHISYLNLRKFR